MKRPLLLDLFCGAGGAAMGYHRAGFDVIGVDIEPQPDYPFPFFQGDALTVVNLDRFDAIHASPPCADHSPLAAIKGPSGTGWLLPAVRGLLTAWGGLYVIENVPGAEMIDPMILCGTEFDLSALDAEGQRRWLRRHRLFESSVRLYRKGSCQCRSVPIGSVHGGGGGAPRQTVGRDGRRRGGYQFHADAARTALGVPWMNRDRATQSIPPAYTEWIGRQLISEVTR